jgi:hypothetical protein
MSELPTYQEASEALQVVWDEVFGPALDSIHEAKDYTNRELDFWRNSEPAKGVRSMRFRVLRGNQQYCDMLMTRILGVLEQMLPGNAIHRYTHHNPWDVAHNEDFSKNYDLIAKGNCLKIYHRPWQPGEWRKIEEADEGYALTLNTHDRVKIIDGPDKGKTGEIIKCHRYSQRRPYYEVKYDEPIEHVISDSWTYIDETTLKLEPYVEKI